MTRAPRAAASAFSVPRVLRGLSGGLPGAAVAVGLKPGLFDVALVVLNAELDHDVHQEIQEALDVLAREFLAGTALLDQQYQLLKGQFRARGVHTGDRSGVPRVDVAQIVKRLLRPELREQNPVRLHTQARFQQLLRRDASEALVVLAVEKPHMIGMAVEHQLLCVLNRNEALLARNLPNERLGVRRLSRPRGA